MENRLELQIYMIEYFRELKSDKENLYMTIDEAAMKFVEDGYATKYNEVYYHGITREELRDKLF